MKTFKKTNIIISVVVFAVLLIIGYSVSTINTNNLFKFFTVTDTLDNPPGADETVSGMFNERGFYKSSNNSIDEHEIINDYNGNLQYSIPIYNMKGPGDIFFDLSLNYNGSVNYQLFASTLYDAKANNSLRPYNISAPGWIFSVNGMAVQMLNFETKFFTNPPDQTSNPIIKNQNIRLLASGYQITDRLKLPGGSSDQDIIFLMMGDGSVINLKRISTSSGGDLNDDHYIGDYYVNNKLSYIRAKVEFIESGGHPSYRNRRLSFMKGDGLTYIYEENKLDYDDYRTGQGSVHYNPQAFLLTQIIDEFGNSIHFTYSTLIDGVKVYGRPVLTHIIGSWLHLNAKVLATSITYHGIGYDNLTRINIYNPSKGKYSFDFSSFSLYSDGNHRSYLNSMTTPYGDVLTVDHAIYRRKAINLTNPLNPPGGQMSIEFENNSNLGLKRISQVTNFNGGIREYTYLSGSEEINMSPAYGKVMSSVYYGQGRDLFFVNMLASKTTKTENQVTIKQETFSYSYDYHSRADWQTDPINHNDDYYSERLTQSTASEFLYQTPTKFHLKKFFKNYKLYAGLPFNPENPDWPGITKTIWEKYDTTGNSANYFREISYDFEKQPNGDIFVGSFLDTVITETINGISRKSSARYEHSNGPLGNTVDNPITKKTEYDPLLKRTETSYLVIFDSSSHYRNAIYFANESIYNQIIDTCYFYLISKPWKIETFSPQGNLIFKETYDIITSDDKTTGIDGQTGSIGSITTSNEYAYLGQIIRKKVFTPGSSNFLSTEYKYNHNDTLGRFLFPVPDTKPSTEGKLKETIDPNGLSTKYYYHLVIIAPNDPVLPQQETDNQNFGIHPKLKYLVAYDTGIDTASEYWEDWRFPVRIDKYSSSNQYLSTFYQYDPSGNVSKDISANLYITTNKFDALNRIREITLPHDYSTQNDTTLLFIDTTYTDTLLTSGTIGWGKSDEVSHTGSLYDREAMIQGLGYFKMIYISPGGQINWDSPPPGVTAISAVMKFDKNSFQNLDSVEYAKLEFYPWRFKNIVGNDTNNPTAYWVSIKPYSTLSGGSNYLSYNLGTGYANFNNLQYVDHPDVPCVGQITLFRLYHSQSCNLLDLTNLFKQNWTSNGYDIEGLHMSAHASGISYPPYHLEMVLDYCTYSLWGDYTPVINIKAKYRRIDTLKYKINKSSTVEYLYDDPNNLTQINYKLNSQNSKKIDYIFDNFYKVKKQKIHTGYLTYDSTQFFYNYLDQKAKVTDARNNSTKYSYNEYGTLSKTENADNSASLVSEGYYSSLTTHWDSYTGFIHKQVYEDETGRNFEKYFDAVDNLLREVKYVPYNNEPDTPYDPDSTYDGNDNPGDLAVYTDYRYDNMYRVTGVYTPNLKTIEYTYDGYGRQITRTTPDAGLTKYLYDKNSNLTYSQDANQYSRASNIYTFRVYDGLNRLLRLCETQYGSSLPNFENLDGSTSIEEDDNPPTQDYYLLINVYDTLSSAAIITFTPPTGYYGSASNNTKGNLVATAYRTRGTDNWNFKYYRYDARGRVVKMWHYIDGLGWKVINNAYNSQNQLNYLNYNPGGAANKLFKYTYDDAARLSDVSLYVGQNPIPDEIEGDFPGDYQNFTSYTYNENSQVYYHNFNGGGLQTFYYYNNRNWILAMQNTTPTTIFKYGLLYDPNGNVRTQILQGSYSSNFTDNNYLNMTYIYDKSNRLLKANNTNLSNNTFDLINTYDKDGNILTLKRYGSSNNIVDNFDYNYISGTNKLRKVAGLSDQYEYDNNGNMIQDDVNRNDTLIYDHRNLLTEFGSTRTVDSPFGPVDEYYHTYYYYDEAGNRTRKLIWKYNGGEPEPIFAEDSPYWDVFLNEFYVRDVSGKEIAIYQDTTLYQWNVWGLDNVGKLDNNGDRFFYLKDHLGSIRVVVDSRYNVVSAQDYDMWGHILENRSYTSAVSKYRFTGKERDNESNYDYFGARYYVSRIGRWGGAEPLLSKYLSWTPYCYGLNNSIRLLDNNGKVVKISGDNIITSFGRLSNSSKLTMTISNEGIIQTDRLSKSQRNKLSESDLKLYNAIRNEEKTVNIVSRDNPYLGIDKSGKQKFIIGGAKGDMSEDKKQVTHYFNLKSADRLGTEGIMYSGNLLKHEIIEGYLRFENNNDQPAAHEEVIGMEDMKIPSFAEDWYVKGIDISKDVIQMNVVLPNDDNRVIENIYQFDFSTGATR